MCYCDLPDAVILDDIVRGSIPDHAYANSCCWRRICQVRGRYYSQVDREVWVDICRTRGYVLARQNPRGF